jgi:hypothetical protein
MSDQLQFGDIAKRLNVDVSTVRRRVARFAPRLGIEVQKGRSSSTARWATFLSREDAERLIGAYEKQGGMVDNGDEGSGEELREFGYFYIIQLVPEAIPNRIKIGYTDDLEQRLSDHQTAAPTARVIANWPCKRSWDYAAMDSITRKDCRWVLNEVWEGDPDGFVKRGNEFFSNMPNEGQERPLSDYSPLKGEALNDA